MAIYSPINLLPNNTSVNAATPITFYWDFNSDDGSGQTDFQIKIYKNSDNTLMHDSTKITSVNEYYTLSSTPLTNGNTYKFQVTAWSGANTAKSAWTLFYCNSPATLILGSTPTNQQNYTFTATYNQSQNIYLETYEANLYLAATPSIPISSSGIIYPDTLVGNGGIVSWTFDGMESGTQYAVKFYGTTQRGEEIQTSLTNFAITYNYPPSISDLVLIPNNSIGTITLDWTALKQVLGEVTGSYSYVSGKFNKGIELSYGSTLSYSSEFFPSDFTLYLWVKLPTGFSGDIAVFGTNGTGMRVFYDGARGGFGFSHSNFITIGKTASNVINSFTFIAIKYKKIIVKTSSYQETITI